MVIIMEAGFQCSPPPILLSYMRYSLSSSQLLCSIKFLFNLKRNGLCLFDTHRLLYDPDQQPRMSDYLYRDPTSGPPLTAKAHRHRDPLPI